ncbi:Predicted O-methyltransferase YrrM [Apibacter mensalis]|uniref:Predicted O-methyltransferase YrrM n=1 Tax=Apibacter mensalis TaxID=1586267 RepID=A0A0X3ANZ9_9FLAO|nr:O-methyltransferase [Apibacter mensalis]CVK15877.1 Predicted O-methyltransferase YrrM [Apibacter mensalis]
MELTPLLEDYIEKNSSEEPTLLKELRRETFLKTTQPHMLSGLLQGRLLSMISKLISPRLIIEIGTFTGYATLCLAEGLSESGKIITVDNNYETAYIPKKYFQKSEFYKKINFILDDAINVIQRINEEIDMVFLDADKKNYNKYVEMLKPKLRSGGIIIADNILWKGKVVGNFKDKKTESIREFNSYIRSDSSLEVIILPIRDGISIIRKK